MSQPKNPIAITEVAVVGFKSYRDEQRISIGPLTLLAGANNSGKSSIMKPLLLMKQSFEMLINGVNPGGGASIRL
jgi:AAA15 family ATPase/GTPase